MYNPVKAHATDLAGVAGNLSMSAQRLATLAASPLTEETFIAMNVERDRFTTLLDAAASLIHPEWASDYREPVA